MVRESDTIPASSPAVMSLDPRSIIYSNHNITSISVVSQYPEMAELLSADTKIVECFLEHPVFGEQGRVPFQFKTLEECAQMSY